MDESVNKSMLDLNYEGKHIKLWPDHTVEKWAKIQHATTQGVVVEFTRLEEHGRKSYYSVGDVMFVPWNKLTFIFTEK